MQLVLYDANDGDPDEDHERHGEGHHDMACEGEAEGDHSPEIAHQHEHEDGEDERKIGPSLDAHGIAHEVRDKHVAELGHGLPAAGHQLGTAHAHDQE